MTDRSDRAGGDGLRDPTKLEALAFDQIRAEAERHWLNYHNTTTRTSIEWPKDDLAYWIACVALSHRASPPSGNARERKPEPEIEDRISQLTAALESISKNTCCDNCREAALVARSALASYVGLARETLTLTTPPQPAPNAMREALKDARDAIATLPEDSFGFGSYSDESQWPIRDELLAKINAALSPPLPSGEPLANAIRALELLGQSDEKFRYPVDHAISTLRGSIGETGVGVGQTRDSS